MQSTLLKNVQGHLCRGRNGSRKCSQQLVHLNPTEGAPLGARGVSSVGGYARKYTKECVDHHVSPYVWHFTLDSSFSRRAIISSGILSGNSHAFRTYGECHDILPVETQKLKHSMLPKHMNFATNTKSKKTGKDADGKKDSTKQYEGSSQSMTNDPFSEGINESSGLKGYPYEGMENIGEKKKKSKLKVLVYLFIISFGGYVSYKVYQNDMNLSKAEESIVKDFVHLIYTYEEKMSKQNSKFMTCLSEKLNKQIAMYFLQLDADKSSGFLISDALSFLSDLNIKEDNAIVKSFIKNGVGKNMEMKKLSGCSLQQFAELLESLILVSKTKQENGLAQGGEIQTDSNQDNNYLNVLQNYLNCLVTIVKTSNLYLYIQMKKNAASSSASSSEGGQEGEQIDDLEMAILNKLTKYNDKYVQKQNLTLEYLLSKEELSNFKKNANLSRREEEKELLLIEKKKLEEKIQLMLKLQEKKNLTETEIKRLQDLKIKLRNVKYTIKKEELMKYFQ
ncbi:conserved Plasmodium protein, unknown function [Plasmodium knowlesi strain H]|uniref:Uncharacterized protein n=3 Tax=Plasmodium knowlesi TaxID=5850 RepID=A0A5K1V1K3_PLAKH|nr:uncharacterized protein PKNH_0108800 [Plasmodium knowlesi strain H]OTN68752.1 Uncharacterized protein PKNOH_S01017100 [Plasmodium knowlesi]CAA9986168.1 conserved protein, unknown function [Plasmodium knowlesi strain H]SBO25361.1 conserved Plasmodium protein, unknown function [Plasmodium knowlesi strain H]SBO27662.1 conserved Plasmodium protein, unknown function [Plasmodium knowlesi strain H]VVS75642.1 conserved protein, unknown function [Plasmodium knowlesi strain H]|eukprot:XP_002257579.1 [Plasmodium knowlesi strain H]